MNGHGGKRRGAGRKPGGGIPPARALRSEARAILAEIVGTARDPLMVAIDFAADATKPDSLRLEAALGVCRYMHPVLSAAAIVHTQRPAPADTSARDRLTDRLSRLASPDPFPSPPIDAVAEPSPAARPANDR